MQLIKQEKNPTPPPVYVKHDKYGYKVVEAKELVNCIAVGWRKLVNPTWLYHKTAGSDIFCETEVEELLERGWVESPADLNPIIDVEAEEEIAKSIDLSSEEMLLVNTVAKSLLADEGLNKASLMRALGKKHKNTTQRNRFEPIYKAVINYHADSIKMQGRDWFWKKPNDDIVNKESVVKE